MTINHLATPTNAASEGAIKSKGDARFHGSGVTCQLKPKIRFVLRPLLYIMGPPLLDDLTLFRPCFNFQVPKEGRGVLCVCLCYCIREQKISEFTLVVKIFFFDSIFCQKSTVRHSGVQISRRSNLREDALLQSW
jgi:hypothetical protein